MAKQIIILNLTDNSAASASVTLAGVYWLAVVPGQELPLPVFTSAYSGALAAETTALQLGSVIEISFSKIFSSAATAAQIKAVLVAEFTTLQAAQTGKASPKKFFGIFYDGSVWSA